MTALHVRIDDTEKLTFANAIELSIILPGAATGGAFAIFEDVVQPNVGPPRHIHRSQDEVFFVLDGRFDIEIDGRLHRAETGDVAYVPRGSVHAFKNVGGAPGKLRYTFTPAGQTEAMFRALFAAQDGNGLTSERMRDIAAEYDQLIVGEPL